MIVHTLIYDSSSLSMVIQVTWVSSIKEFTYNRTRPRQETLRICSLTCFCHRCHGRTEGQSENSNRCGYSLKIEPCGRFRTVDPEHRSHQEVNPQPSGGHPRVGRSPGTPL